MPWRQGLTARSALEKFAAVQMSRCPPTDNRRAGVALLTRYTQPEPELRLLIEQLTKLSLPPQPTPAHRKAPRAVPSGPNNPRP